MQSSSRLARKWSCADAQQNTLPYFQVQRARMILHAAEGMANDQIAQRLAPRRRSSPCGANASLPTVSQVWKSMLVRVAPGLFPPDLVVQIKALACELPAKFGLPLSRWSTDDLFRQVCQNGIVPTISRRSH